MNVIRRTPFEILSNFIRAAQCTMPDVDGRSILCFMYCHFLFLTQLMNIHIHIYFIVLDSVTINTEVFEEIVLLDGKFVSGLRRLRLTAERSAILRIYKKHTFFRFFMAQQPLVGQGLLIIEASRSHSDTPQSVGLL